MKKIHFAIYIIKEEWHPKSLDHVVCPVAINFCSGKKNRDSEYVLLYPDHKDKITCKKCLETIERNEKAKKEERLKKQKERLKKLKKLEKLEKVKQ